MVVVVMVMVIMEAVVVVCKHDRTNSCMWMEFGSGARGGFHQTRLRLTAAALAVRGQ